MVDKPEYADPERYAELAAFDGSFRDLWHDHGFLRMLSGRLELGDAAEVLDVGCGAGHWGRTVVQHITPRAGLTGVDREQHFVALAAEQAAAAGLAERSTYVEGNAEALPFKDNTFDLVTCQTVLIHVPDVAAAVREMVRVAKPGGVLLLAEPDNCAGNLALLGGEPRLPDEDVLAIVEMLLTYRRGKIALGEGDDSIGSCLPGVLAAAGCTGAAALNNPQCVYVYPPYERPEMRVLLDQERAWAKDDISTLTGTRGDTLRFYRAAGGSDEAFDRSWAAVRRWTQERFAAVDAGTHHAARGYVMYLASGRKPGE